MTFYYKGCVFNLNDNILYFIVDNDDLEIISSDDHKQKCDLLDEETEMNLFGINTYENQLDEFMKNNNYLKFIRSKDIIYVNPDKIFTISSHFSFDFYYIIRFINDEDNIRINMDMDENNKINMKEIYNYYIKKSGKNIKSVN